jgi:hypothetical protein
MSIISAHSEIVIGAFEDPANAEYAIRKLREVGFTDSEIGVISRSSSDDDEDAFRAEPESHNNATEGAAAGAAAGFGLGALWGLGILAGFVPAIGPAIAAGTSGAVLSSAAVGAATLGFAGTLIGLGVPKEEASFYENELVAGRTVVLVKAGDRADAAAAIFSRALSYEQ